MKDKMMNGFLMFATKIQGQRHINAIKNGFTNLMPIIIVGSICTLLSNVVCNTTEGYVSLANIPGMSWLGSLKPIFDAANYGTMNMMAIGVCVLVAMELGMSLGQNDWAIPVTSLACYISVVDTSNGLGGSVTGAAGLFVALIVALVATELYCKLVSSGKLSIHMPDSVPSNVAKSFSILLPCAVVIFAVSAFGFAFTALTGMMVPEAIVKFIQTPLSGVMTHPLGILVIAFMCSLLWVFGIHGPNTLNGIYEPIFLAAYAENEAAYAAGMAAPNIVCSPFWSTFFSLTGSGITGGLLIAIFLFSKREDFRAIAKLALPCGIFNINEPLIFGIPIVMNPMLMIPFMLSPLASVGIGYLLTAIGFCPRLVVNAPWTTPPFLCGFLAGGGSITAGISQIIVILVAAVIYTPFVIALNNQEVPAEE
ncbi:MAG: PTS sugar transporter subunit IIC [Hungatella sp.]|jgi:PTS system cellobiose-specific IIC component|nr:PTS sugar transporter subunit IIC [Hungatella sp.]